MNCGMPPAPTGTSIGREPGACAAGMTPMPWHGCIGTAPHALLAPKKLGSEPSKNLSEGDMQQLGSKTLPAGEGHAGELGTHRWGSSALCLEIADTGSIGAATSWRRATKLLEQSMA